MTTAPASPAAGDEAPRRSDRVLYALIAVVVGGLLVWGLISYGFERVSPEARAKAEQLLAAAKAAGLPTTRSVKEVARTLGTDGGAVCEDPGKALNTAILNGQLATGSAGPGQRPLIADRLVLRGEELIIRTYCPEQLPQFRQDVRDYDFDDVVRR